MDLITIYTDGGCTGNPGPGGWGVVVLIGDKEILLSGGSDATTNNKMEMTAVIESLKYLSLNKYSPEKIALYTDSQYVKNGINSWMANWIKNGWKTAAKKPVKNKDLWIELKEWCDKFNLEWHWVKGHSGNKYNEMCDKLVEDERLKRA